MDDDVDTMTAGNGSGKFAIDSDTGALTYVGEGEYYASFVSPQRLHADRERALSSSRPSPPGM